MSNGVESTVEVYDALLKVGEELAARINHRRVKEVEAPVPPASYST